MNLTGDQCSKGVKEEVGEWRKEEKLLVSIGSPFLLFFFLPNSMFAQPSERRRGTLPFGPFPPFFILGLRWLFRRGRGRLWHGVLVSPSGAGELEQKMSEDKSSENALWPGRGIACLVPDLWNGVFLLLFNFYG
ncbi:hypothetical protein BD289DRAFT_273283 [Coniella lustricola]|uniref:Uncharacterized protein n=1 Tax=Coniella lustricola TaxID=2025994 RepID=A0A2T3A6T6_9PEZI|nr:hypothetical protein BD289DRAFT_273283 [Coniella lustricola]